MIEQVQFDTIYHEHYSYLSLFSVEGLFRKVGLRVFDVEEIPTHGGSLRVFACLTDADFIESPNVQRVRDKETAARLDRIDGYIGYADRVKRVKRDLIAYLRDAKEQGRTIAAYGAAAKGNTLLNYCAITSADIAYVVDRNPAKQGSLLPGSRIPVRPVEALYQDRPGDLLILPWNLKEEVAQQLADLKARGVRFVTAIPCLTIVP
jgi:hypothetical protein